MAVFLPFLNVVPALAIALVVLMVPVHAQNRIPCTASMLTSFTPCMNFVTNSTTNATSPTADCCNSLRSITRSGSDCLCGIVTGIVPFQIPVNRTLAVSLPRACNMPGVPLQCKASSAPIPAPGPVAFSPSPGAPTSLSPMGSSIPKTVPPALAPEADLTPPSPTDASVPALAPEADLTPPSPTDASEAPTANSGIRPVLTPSAAHPSHCFSPSLPLLTLLGAMALKYY